MSGVISSHLTGGLGNQLFQIAHAVAQGLKHGREVVFLPQSWTPGQGRGAETYVENVFRNVTFVERLEGFTTVRERSFEYNPVDPVEGDTLFEGFFQSSKHWFGFDDKIRELFQPPSEVVTDLRARYPQLNNPKTLSIHIRRGEYLTFPDKHPPLSVEYFYEALRKLGEYSAVFVFADEEARWPGSSDFVLKNFPLPNVIFPKEDEDWKELYLMGLCANHIISNSTFSWWATFLGNRGDKTIIAPSRWFGPRGPSGEDIYEANWSLVDVVWKDGELTPLP